MLNIPDWVTSKTSIACYSHDLFDAWVEVHKNPQSGKIIYIAARVTDGQAKDVGRGVYENYKQAFDAIGDIYGHTLNWRHNALRAAAI